MEGEVGWATIVRCGFSAGEQTDDDLNGSATGVDMNKAGRLHGLFRVRDTDFQPCRATIGVLHLGGNCALPISAGGLRMDASKLSHRPRYHSRDQVGKEKITGGGVWEESFVDNPDLPAIITVEQCYTYRHSDIIWLRRHHAQ